MGLATEAKVREAGNLPASGVLPDGRINVFFKIAEYRLREWIGDVVYDAAVAAVGNDPIKARLTESENFLVCHFGVRASWNMAVTQQGIVSQKVVGNEGGTITLLSKDERESLAAHFLELAAYCAKPYLTAGGSFEFEVSRANYEDEEA